MVEYPQEPSDIANAMDPEELEQQQWVADTFPDLGDKVAQLTDLLTTFAQGSPSARADLDEAWDMTARWETAERASDEVRRASLARDIIRIVGDNADNQLWDLIYDRLPKELR